MTYATYIRLSMLSQHHQQQLREILDSVGVTLTVGGRSANPVHVKFINDISTISGYRSRSVTPSRVGAKSRPRGRSKTPDPSLRHRSGDLSKVNEISAEFSAVFDPNSFKHLSMWQFKPMSVAILSARVEELLAAIMDALRRSQKMDQKDLSVVLLRYFQERLGLRSLVEFNFLDLLGNVMDHRRTVMEVDIFARILTGFYDSVDVLFYDFAKRNVRGHAGGSKMLTLRDCEEITRKMFGQEQVIVGDAVLSTLQEELDGLALEEGTTTTINVSYFEYISVWVFHHQRLEPNVRDSLNQFTNILRESLSTIGTAPNNLIDSYIDSIIQLKNQTRLELEKPETDDLSQMVGEILERSCQRKTGASVVDSSILQQADQLMRAVMNEDLASWIKVGATPIEFNRAAWARDQLLRAVEGDTADVERLLEAFCDKIVEGLVIWFCFVLTHAIQIPMPSPSFPDRLRFIVSSIGNPVCCHSKPSKKMRRQQRKIEMTDFIFGAPTKTSNAVFVVNGIASLGAAILAGQSVATAAAVAACVPIIVPMTNALVDAGVPIGNDAKNSMSHMTTINSIQLSFGMIEFLTGDIVNGFIHMLMAGVGFYVVKVDGIVLLPSYSVSCTVFATVSLLNLIEMIMYKGNISGELALTANFIKLATICHPILYAASAYLAWNLIDQLRTGLLPAAQPAPDNQADPNSRIMFEPSQIVQRQPFAGRGFRLNSAASSE